MKKIPILLTLWFAPVIVLANSPSVELRDALSEAGIADRPIPPTFGELMINPSYLADIKKLPPERKEKLADQLTRIVPRLSQERPAPTISREVSPVSSGPSPKLGILILQEIGTDEQKIEALRNLDLYGDSLSDACQALSTCEGPEGVEILKQYAESQFAELDKDGSQTPKGRAHTKPDVNIYLAVIALAGAYHPDGLVAADILKNRLLDLAKVRLDATRLASVEKDFAKDMERARHNRENLIREKRPDNKRNPKPGSISTETSGTIADSSSRVINSKWFWPSTAALLLVLAYYVFIWRKSCR